MKTKVALATGLSIVSRRFCPRADSSATWHGRCNRIGVSTGLPNKADSHKSSRGAYSGWYKNDIRLLSRGAESESSCPQPGTLRIQPINANLSAHRQWRYDSNEIAPISRPATLLRQRQPEPIARRKSVISGQRERGGQASGKTRYAAARIGDFYSRRASSSAANSLKPQEIQIDMEFVHIDLASYPE